MSDLLHKAAIEGDPEVWYRYVDGRYAPPLDEWERPCGESTPYIQLQRIPVEKVTPAGVWLQDGFHPSGRRFVLRDARKRYACPTLAEALASFQARKARQKRILSAQLRQVERCLELAVAEWDTVSMMPADVVETERNER